jgi:hypothetical protein
MKGKTATSMTSRKAIDQGMVDTREHGRRNEARLVGPQVGGH